MPTLRPTGRLPHRSPYARTGSPARGQFAAAGASEPPLHGSRPLLEDRPRASRRSSRPGSERVSAPGTSAPGLDLLLTHHPMWLPTSREAVSPVYDGHAEVFIVTARSV